MINHCKIRVLFLCVAAASSFLTGCAWPGGFPVDTSDTRFIVDLPAGVSSAWLKGSTLWIVPSKDVIIDAASNTAGKTWRVEPTGAYLTIASPPEYLSVSINGVLGSLKVPSYNKN